MSQNYNFPRTSLLNRIGLAPGNKLVVFLVSLVVVTIPMGYIYNSLAIIFFVLYSILAARMPNFSLRASLLVPVALFVVMAVSLLWTLDVKSSLMALSKEASLLFIPLAFILNRRLPHRQVNNVVKNYTIAMCLFGVYILFRALYRYFSGEGINVFFHDELGIHEINAVYLSALFSLAFFVFLNKKQKTFWGYAAMYFLFVIIMLLSSKTVVFIDVIIIIGYYIFVSGLPAKTVAASVTAICITALVFGYAGKLYDKYRQEIQGGCVTNLENNNYATISQAWQQDNLNNYHFSSTAFRVYQARIFKELLAEEPIFFTGYGLNASRYKVEQKGIEHKVTHSNQEGNNYNSLNFHNQYIEAFADLGILGFALVVVLVLLNLIMAIKSKYFVHIAFSILMISLFLTESFLWRQRGVVFFTVFYCLFNDLLPPVKRTMYGNTNFKPASTS